ncbi:signal transduction histidine kinase [Stackebrandtia endophytica]|uniref:histidine kinase n=2 Tax=Stackebrandtia endophytica TaxID=1496996 RepID=A0A543AQR1_9ACTN|nr:signal transduction histidine kinase [Stackebrandtia endophytica]
MDALPRPLDPVPSLKVKVGLLLLCSGGAGLCVLWFGLGMMPPKTTATAAIAAVLTSQILAHGMTSPLRQMTAAAEAMARGDYSRRVRSTARDEVGQLADAFNHMADDLALADERRRELIANVSHELRTPISALRAQLENLADGVSTPDEQSLRAALRHTERLGNLVTDLLDVSRLESGTVELRTGWFTADEFLRDGAAATGVDPARLDVDIPPDLRIHADAGRLEQVITNLVGNADQHGGPEGRIRLSAHSTAGQLTIVVADDGPGIPPAERHRVFERFNRGDRASGAGTGLGLAIARSAVELHGGTIAVVDTESGCAIEVTLPQPKGRS